MTNPFLSIIIPAHDEENRLPGTLEKIFAFLEEQSYLAEVLVVENGSQDNTLEIANTYAARYPGLRVFHESGRRR